MKASYIAGVSFFLGIALTSPGVADDPPSPQARLRQAEQAVRAKTKEKGIALCFVEIDFCMIMTPLTAFRGHDHQAHPGGLHAHDAPDPPWTWSVTPPEPVVSWEGQ